jgi:hypothetical protein
LVAGEDKDKNRKTRIVGTGTGLERRELYTDARDIQSEKEDGTQMTEAEYYELLDARGASKLSENQVSKAFDAKIETTRVFVFNEDFFIGDIVQIESENDVKKKARITEAVRSQNENGFEIYPTYEIL